MLVRGRGSSVQTIVLLLAAGCSGSSKSTGPNNNPGPSKDFVYVANGGDNTISQFSVSSTGALKPLTPFTVAAGAFPAKLLADPQGKYLFAKNANDGTMSQYVIGSDGQLTPNGSLSGLGGGGYAGMHPNGGYIYVTSYSPTIQQLIVNASGTLSKNATPTATVTGSTTGMAFTPDGAFAYAAAFGAEVINQMSIDGSGRLTPLSPGSIAVATNPRQVAVTPDAKYLYSVSTTGNMISQFKIGADGKLTPNALQPTIFIGNPGAITISHNGKWVYVGLDFAVGQFFVTSTGLLQPQGAPTYGGLSSFNMVTSPEDKYFYFTTFTNDVGQAAIGADGRLQPLSTGTTKVVSGKQTWGIAYVRK